MILFEYLTLLLHPYVAEITHHTPVYELIIFVCIAALLIPTHHRIEHWLIEKLTCRRHHIEALHKAHPKENNKNLPVVHRKVFIYKSIQFNQEFLLVWSMQNPCRLYQ